MDVIAREYGWTFQDIREMSVSEVMAVWKVITTRRDLEKAAQKRARGRV